MGKKITLTESQLIRVIERVVMEQQGMSSPDPMKSSKLSNLANRSPQVKAVIDGFNDAPDKFAYLEKMVLRFLQKSPMKQKIDSLLNRVKSDKNFCSAVQAEYKNAQASMGAEKSTGAMFLIAIAIILLVAFIPTGGGRSCADQMGLTGR